MSDLILPNVHAQFMDENGRPTREFYSYLRDITNSQQSQIDTIAQAVAAIGSLNQTVGGLRTPYIKGIDSLAGDSVTQQMSLVNDAAAPAANDFYGTDGAGVRGFMAVRDAALSLSDITTNNVSITKHGFAPKAPNDPSKYLDGTGAYSTPAGGSGGALTYVGQGIVSGSAATSVTVSSLNLATDARYVLEIVAKDASGSSNGLFLYLNGDTTSTNYYRSYVLPAGSASGSNSAGIGTLDANANYAAHGSMRADLSSYPRTILHVTYEETANFTSGVFTHKRNNTANVTSITLQCANTNGLAVGSFVRVWKLT